jgi:DNA-binding transcriptional regulator YdaS (Cro superfamily)
MDKPHKTHKLFKYLDHHGTSQKWFANKINITPNNLNMILHGRRTPGLKLALKIENATGGLVTVYDLAKESERLKDACEDLE